MSLVIERIEVQGFRAFGRVGQRLDFGSPLAAVWAPNSQGKTSLAEAIEFLLTGQIVRRQLMASTQDEFTDALRNAHMPAATPVFVEVSLHGSDKILHTVRRTLITDYGKQQDCVSVVEIDGKPSDQEELAALGIILSQPPLAAPVLAQHTLGYLFSAKPQDRATYFKAILEVTDLDDLRAVVAGLDATVAPEETPSWKKLAAAAAIAAAKPHLQPLLTTISSSEELPQRLDEAIATILQNAEPNAGASAAERVTGLEELLLARRAQTFPIDGFDRKALSPWDVPPQADWDKLANYLEECTKVDEETQRLASLFGAALSIPDIDTATEPLDCPLCGATQTLTPERIAFIRSQAAETEAYKTAEKAALETQRQLTLRASALDAAGTAACPRSLTMMAKERRQGGFRLERIRALVGPDSAGLVQTWLENYRNLARHRSVIRIRALALKEEVKGLATLNSCDQIANAQAMFASAAVAYDAFSRSLQTYSKAEEEMIAALKAVVDEASETAGWQDLIDLARDPNGLRVALVDRHSRTALQKELKSALGQIDKGNEAVLNEKFAELSGQIQYWWDLLRPDEPTFFAGVKPRKGTRRTIDFKAGLSLGDDRANPKLRDVIAVFSQSQLHCLGMALFIARTLQEGSQFIVLDDPILSSDEDYRAYFKANVLQELVDRGVQVIMLTQDQKSWKDIEHRYLHLKIDMFQLAMLNRADGTTVTKTSDDLMAMLTRIEVLARGGHADLHKQAGELLRNAGERFCKEMLVRKRKADGDMHAELSDYDRKNLGELSPPVEGMLKLDPSHPGKLRSIGNVMNPAKHDDTIPDQGTLKVALGDLRTLRKQYLQF